MKKDAYIHCPRQLDMLHQKTLHSRTYTTLKYPFSTLNDYVTRHSVKKNAKQAQTEETSKHPASKRKARDTQVRTPGKKAGRKYRH